MVFHFAGDIKTFSGTDCVSETALTRPRCFFTRRATTYSWKRAPVPWTPPNIPSAAPVSRRLILSKIPGVFIFLPPTRPGTTAVFTVGRARALRDPRVRGERTNASLFATAARPCAVGRVPTFRVWSAARRVSSKPFSLRRGSSITNWAPAVYSLKLA